MPRPQSSAILASDKGAIDLSSVITAAILCAVMFLGVVAVLFGLIPFVQDNGARQDLAAIRTAEATAVARDGHYYDHEGLQAENLVSDIGRTVVGTDTARSCYVAMTKSGSGKFFYSTNSSGDARRLEAGTVTGCIDFDAQIALSEKIGAPSPSYGDLENGSFEDDFAGWRTGPAGGSTPLISTTKSDLADGVKAANLLPMTYVEQDVRVPSDGAAVLSLSARIYTAGSSTTSAPLKLEVLSRTKELAGTPAASVQASRNHTLISYDLTEFAGQNVTVRLSVASTPSVLWTSVDKVSLDASAASAPANVVGYTRDSAAVLIWDEPALGLRSVTSYVITAYRDGKAVKEMTVTGTPPAATATMDGLDNGTSYTFGVTAVNRVGDSPESAKSQALPVNPSAVANGSFEAGLVAWNTAGTVAVDSSASQGKRSALLSLGSYIEQDVRIPGNGLVRLEASVKAQGRYTSSKASIKVEFYDKDGALLGTVPAEGYGGTSSFMPATADLTAYRGQNVTLRISPNALVDASGVYLDNVRVTESAPSAPSAPRGYGSDSAAHLIWNPSASSTSYVLTAYKAGTEVKEVTTDTTSVVVTGLANGTSYTFKVKAVNDVGTSPISAASVSILAGDQIITNGSFEGGLAAWNAVGATVYVGGTTDSGSSAVDLPLNASISQRVKIPSGASASLDLKTLMDSGDRTARGSVVVEVKDLDGMVLTTRTISTLYYFAPTSIDLSPYMGKEVILSFTGKDAKATRIDSVAVTVR